MFLLRAIGSTCNVGDQLLWWFRLSPVYCVADSILWASSGPLVLGTVRNAPGLDPASKLAQCGPIPTDLWALENLGGNALMMAGNFAIGIILLVLIEMRLCDRCRKFTLRTIPAKKLLNMDDDVEHEEERVCN